MRKTSLLSLLLVLTIQLVHAQDSGLAFLRPAANAAGIAMGDATVAYSADAFSGLHNPAGLAFASGSSLAVSHHRWIGDMNTNVVTGRLPVGHAAGVGLYVKRTGTDDLEARDRPGAPTGSFAATYVAAGFAYGQRFGPVAIGAGFKILSEQIYEQSARGFAFDFGVQASLLRGALRTGATLQNTGRMNELFAEASDLPQTIKVGAAVYPLRLTASADNARILDTFLTAEYEHDLSSEDASRIHLGASAEVLETVVVRAGYIFNDELRKFSLGGGLELGPLGFDYAYVPFVNGFDATGHVLSLGYSW